MATENERSRDGIIVLTEKDELYIIPKRVLEDPKLNLKYTGHDKDSLSQTLIKTGRLKNLKAARQIEGSVASQDVSLFGGAFPDPA